MLIFLQRNVDKTIKTVYQGDLYVEVQVFSNHPIHCLYTNFILFICTANVNIASNSAAYILIDANSDKVILEKNADTKLHPASVSKIMTAILAIELGDFSKPCTASSFAVKLYRTWRF